MYIVKGEHPGMGGFFSARYFYILTSEITLYPPCEERAPGRARP